MTPAAAEWISTTVLVQSAASPGPLAGDPCPCQDRWICGPCRVGTHDACSRQLLDREKGVYGPGLAWPPRAAVRTAGPNCLACCICGTCHQPEPPKQLGLFA
jgi:hypothetical protein